MACPRGVTCLNKYRTPWRSTDHQSSPFYHLLWIVQACLVCRCMIKAPITLVVGKTVVLANGTTNVQFWPIKYNSTLSLLCVQKMTAKPCNEVFSVINWPSDNWQFLPHHTFESWLMSQNFCHSFWTKKHQEARKNLHGCFWMPFVFAYHILQAEGRG